ncbi:MAG: FCD domain-containing protein [Rhodobacteraceae bacterium]|nr:FCD domain-containing protein [Paracoccaceae bacterium]
MTNDLKTLSGRAYSLLRRDIIDGSFAPAQPLRLAQLQARYDIGFSPLREALTRLSAEGLVIAESMRGFRVAPLSLDDLRDTMETRIFVETQALRRSIERGGDDWESRIVSTLHALGRQLARSDANDPDSLQALEARHRDFHFALISASGSRRLEQIVENLYLGSERYRTLQPGARAALPKRDLAAEHGAIADAAVARDVEEATRLLSAHYSLTADYLAAAHAARLDAAV